MSRTKKSLSAWWVNASVGVHAPQLRQRDARHRPHARTLRPHHGVDLGTTRLGAPVGLAGLHHVDGRRLERVLVVRGGLAQRGGKGRPAVLAVHHVLEDVVCGRVEAVRTWRRIRVVGAAHWRGEEVNVRERADQRVHELGCAQHRVGVLLEVGVLHRLRHLPAALHALAAHRLDQARGVRLGKRVQLAERVQQLGDQVLAFGRIRRVDEQRPRLPCQVRRIADPLFVAVPTAVGVDVAIEQLRKGVVKHRNVLRHPLVLVAVRRVWRLGRRCVRLRLRVCLCARARRQLEHPDGLADARHGGKVHVVRGRLRHQRLQVVFQRQRPVLPDLLGILRRGAVVYEQGLELLGGFHERVAVPLAGLPAALAARQGQRQAPMPRFALLLRACGVVVEPVAVRGLGLQLTNGGRVLGDGRKHARPVDRAVELHHELKCLAASKLCKSATPLGTMLTDS